MYKLTLTYFLLNFFCVCVFLFYGKILAVAKSDREYYLRTIFPILTYAFVHGMRFGRSIDWNVYYHVYVALGSDVHYNNYEPVFSHICHFLNYLGIPYYLFITLQCAFFMFCILAFLKNFRTYLPFILPLLLPVISANDNLIRWFIGFSFILLSFDSMLNKKQVWMYVWALCAMGCHVGYLLFIPMFIFKDIFNRVVFPPQIATVLLFLTSFVVGLSSMTFIVDISNFLLGIAGGVLPDKANSYLSYASDLIGGTYGHVGYMDRTLRSLIRAAIAYSPALWFAYYYIDKINYGRFIYNCFAVGVILTPLFNVEILNRYALCLAFMSCVSCGVFYYEKFHQKGGLGFQTLLLIVFCFFCAVWPTISSSWKFDDISLCGNNQMFIWDAYGRSAMF